MFLSGHGYPPGAVHRGHSFFISIIPQFTEKQAKKREKIKKMNEKKEKRASMENKRNRPLR